MEEPVDLSISKAKDFAAFGTKIEMGTIKRLAHWFIGIVETANAEEFSTIFLPYSRNNEYINGSSYLGFPSLKLDVRCTFFLESREESLIFAKSYSNLYWITQTHV